MTDGGSPWIRFTIVPSASEQNASNGMAPNGDSTPSPAGSNYTTASESGPVSLQHEHGGAAAMAPPPDYQSSAPNKDLRAQQPQQQVGLFVPKFRTFHIISKKLFFETI